MLNEEAAEVKETASQGTEPPYVATPLAGLDVPDARGSQRPLGEQAHALHAADCALQHKTVTSTGTAHDMHVVRRSCLAGR